MELLANNWTDEARAASLAVRRAKARSRAREAIIARKRKAFFDENPDATEVDWIVHDERELQKWRDERDFERWEKRNPGQSMDDWRRAKRERLDAWWEERAKRDQWIYDAQAEGRRKRGEPYIDAWLPREADGAPYPSYYDEETGRLIELPPDLYGDFTPSGGPPVRYVIDPHWGHYSTNAPYGYHDETGEPRTEPLYTQGGYPIVPRTPHTSARAKRDDPGWQDYEERAAAALQKWGLYGEKKQWLDEHPGMTDADWDAYRQKRWGHSY